MKRRNDLPAGWRQPPETTAEPVPLRRPYVPPGEVFASAHLLPPLPARPRSGPRRWPGAPGQAPGQPQRQAPGQAPRQPPRQAPGQAPGPVPGQPPRPVRGQAPRQAPPGAAAQPGAAAPGATAQPLRRASAPAMRHWRPMRGIIGDAFRMPALWCEFGSCIGRYTSRDALGERDLRARALAAGWCYDPAGRFACPSCARQDPAFRVPRPSAPAAPDRWRR